MPFTKRLVHCGCGVLDSQHFKFVGLNRRGDRRIVKPGGFALGLHCFFGQ